MLRQSCFEDGTEICICFATTSVDRLLLILAGRLAAQQRCERFSDHPRVLPAVAGIKLTSVHPLPFSGHLALTLKVSWQVELHQLPLVLSQPLHSSSLHHNGFLPHSVILNHSYYFFSNVLKGSGSIHSVLPPAESQDPQSIPCPNMNLSHNCCICSQSDLLDLLAASPQKLPPICLSPRHFRKADK